MRPRETSGVKNRKVQVVMLEKASRMSPGRQPWNGAGYGGIAIPERHGWPSVLTAAGRPPEHVLAEILPRDGCATYIQAHVREPQCGDAIYDEVCVG